jgi:hypothetical protein
VPRIDEVLPSATSRIGAASYRQSYDHCEGRRAMALIDTQQTMDAYIRDLLNRGDYSRHYSDDVVVEVRGTDQRYRGREAAKNWVEGIHAVGEIKVRNTFMGETHAVAEAELVRKDGISVPYSVIYDVAAGKITALRLYFTGPVQP